MRVCATRMSRLGFRCGGARYSNVCEYNVVGDFTGHKDEPMKVTVYLCRTRFAPPSYVKREAGRESGRGSGRE